MSKANFRDHIPAPGESPISGRDARSHADGLLNGRADVKDLFDHWQALRAEPFRGITADGGIIPGLFALRPEKAPARTMAEAARGLMETLTPEQRASSCFPMTSDQWRNWQNTELYVEHHGLRLDEVPETVRGACLDVMRASLSDAGYERTRKAMKLNGFLGELVDAPLVMGEFSYTFCLFGTPSRDEPWGWQLFGHHLSLNCVIVGDQMTITPTFMGAEPSYADAGQFAGISLFEDEERLGLALRRSLDERQAGQAHLHQNMMGGDMPPERRQFADQLHYGGAYQDNRIIPYEGIKGSELEAGQQQALLDLTAAYVGTLPEGPFGARMEEVERHLAETRFCWIGAADEDHPFYYRIQSPVIMIEFDHHAGVYLTNTEPANFHVHTLVRTPNGNDYGLDLLRLHYENAPHHRHRHDEA